MTNHVIGFDVTSFIGKKKTHTHVVYS